MIGAADPAKGGCCGFSFRMEARILFLPGVVCKVCVGIAGVMLMLILSPF